MQTEVTGSKIIAQASEGVLPKPSAPEPREKTEFLSTFNLEHTTPTPANPAQFKKPLPKIPKNLDEAVKNLKARKEITVTKKLVPQIIAAPVTDPADKRKKKKPAEIELPDITDDNDNEESIPKSKPPRLLSIDEIAPLKRKNNNKQGAAVKDVKKPSAAKTTRPTAANSNYNELMIHADE